MLNNSQWRLRELLPVLAAAYMTLPEVWTKPLRLGQISLMNILFILCLVASFSEARKRTNSFWVSAGCVALVYMAFRGIASRGEEYFDWKVYLADLLTYCGAIAGMLWARRTSVQQLGRLVRLIAITTVCCLALDWICLYFGIVKPSWEGPRVFIFSMFFGTWWLMAVTPVILATEGTGTGMLSVHFSRMLLCVIVAEMLGVMVTSGTRSVAFELIACGAFCTPLILRNFRTAYAAVILALFIGATAYSVAPHVADLRFFANRLADTDLASEERYTELQLMIDQLMPEIAIGKGFGSSFVSPVIVDGSNLAVAPHIGVLTILFKGGFIVFGLAMALPLMVAIFSIVVNRARPECYACMSGFLLYGIAGSLSGGWGFFHLFLAGLMFSSGLIFAKRPVTETNELDSRMISAILDIMSAREHAVLPSRGVSALH